MPSRRRIAVAALAAASLGATAPTAVAATVTPSNLDGWQFEERNNANIAFAETVGGDALRMSSGSDLAAPNGPLQVGGKAFAFRPELAGQTLASLTELRYSALIDPASKDSAGLNVSINIPVDRDGNGTWDTIMVYEPTYRPANSSTKGAWQSFDALNGDNAWWSTPSL